MSMGTNQQPYFLYKVPLFKSQMSKHNTLEFKLLWQIKKRWKSIARLPLPMVQVQSYYIQAIFALKVQSRREKKTIPQEQTGGQ